MRLGKYIDLDMADDVVGIKALRRIAAEGPRRRQLGLVLEGGTAAPLGFRREEIRLRGARVGEMTNCVWSPRMKVNIGYALISVAAQVGETVQIQRDGGETAARLVELPFL